MSFRETSSFIVKFFGVLFGVLILITLIGYFFLSVQLPFTNKQTQITRATNGYITAQQEMLETFLGQYTTIDVRLHSIDPRDTSVVNSISNQEKSIINQMKQISILIPQNVPSDVSTFLETH